MHAVILAGGPGRRLRPYTAVLPKVLLPMGDRPVLDLTLRQLRAGGVATVTIAASASIELIRAFVGTGEDYGIDVDYRREASPLGTAGALASLPMTEEPFIVLAGAILSDLDYRALACRHDETGAALTMITTVREVQVPLGVLRFGQPNDPDRVTGYDEKPVYRVDAPTGIFVCSPSVLDQIGPDEVLDLPELADRLIAAGRPVHALRSEARCLDLGQFRDYDLALAEFTRLSPWPHTRALEEVA